jgi:hypothetical protein
MQQWNNGKEICAVTCKKASQENAQEETPEDAQEDPLAATSAG